MCVQRGGRAVAATAWDAGSGARSFFSLEASPDSYRPLSTVIWRLRPMRYDISICIYRYISGKMKPQTYTYTKDNSLRATKPGPEPCSTVAAALIYFYFPRLRFCIPYPWSKLFTRYVFVVQLFFYHTLSSSDASSISWMPAARSRHFSLSLPYPFPSPPR